MEKWESRLKNEVIKFEYNCMFQTGKDLVLIYWITDESTFIHPMAEEQLMYIETEFNYN